MNRIFLRDLSDDHVFILANDPYYIFYNTTKIGLCNTFENFDKRCLKEGVRNRVPLLSELFSKEQFLIYVKKLSWFKHMKIEFFEYCYKYPLSYLYNKYKNKRIYQNSINEQIFALIWWDTILPNYSETVIKVHLLTGKSLEQANSIKRKNISNAQKSINYSSGSPVLTQAFTNMNNINIRKTGEFCFLYYICFRDFIKVGCSSQLRRRIATICHEVRQSPIKIRVSTQINTGLAYSIERELLMEFSEDKYYSSIQFCGKHELLINKRDNKILKFLVQRLSREGVGIKLYRNI